MSYRVQQLDVRVETKTLDNVFITAVVSIQFQVLQEKVYEAFYALTDPRRQITAHVFDGEEPFFCNTSLSHYQISKLYLTYFFDSILR